MWQYGISDSIWSKIQNFCQQQILFVSSYNTILIKHGRRSPLKSTNLWNLRIGRISSLENLNKEGFLGIFQLSFTVIFFSEEL